jgi:hypothetical protein
MKHKTFLRAAAREINMDASQLQKLAAKENVPVTDKAALIALGREHQKPDREGPVVSMAIVEREIKKLCAKYNRQYTKDVREGSRIIRSLLNEGNDLREVVLALADALEPVLKSPWHGPDGIQLTPAQVAAIQDVVGPDDGTGLAALRQRYAEMKSVEEP